MNANYDKPDKYFTRCAIGVPIPLLDGTQLSRTHIPVIISEDAYFQNLRNFKETQCHLPNGSAEYSFAVLNHYMAPIFNGCKRWSFDEAEKNQNMRTSPGFPMNLKWKTKKELFDYVTPGTDEKFFKSWFMNQYWENGYKEYTMVYSAVAKRGEMREKLKVLKEGKMRVFLAGSVISTMAGSMLFGSQNERMTCAGRGHPCAIGITLFYRGWDELWNRLNSTKAFIRGIHKLFGGDFGKFDQHMISELLWMVFIIRTFDWPIDENLARAYAFYQDLVNAVCKIFTGELVLKAGGNASGSANTSYDNSMMNILLCAMVVRDWIIATFHREPTIEDFLRFIFQFYGDDVIYRAPDGLMSDILMGLNKYGFVYKTGPEDENVTFLSFGFRWLKDHRLMIPKPDVEKLYSVCLGREADSLSHSFVKACAIRILAWRTPLFPYINEVINRMFPSVGPFATMNAFQVQSLYVRESVIENLYTGHESGSFLQILLGPMIEMFTGQMGSGYLMDMLMFELGNILNEVEGNSLI